MLVMAAASAMLAYGQRAEAQIAPGPGTPCADIVGTTVTCTGDVSAGIIIGAPYETLVVDQLTAPIAPASGVIGIQFFNIGSDITIENNTGTFGIQTTGSGYGMFVYGRDVSITNYGPIHAGTDGTESFGIFALASGSLTINSSGDISVLSQRGAGIYASGGSHPILLTNSGAIQGGDAGIAVVSGVGEVTVYNSAAISSQSGIDVSNSDGEVRVVSTGSIEAVRAGIRVGPFSYFTNSGRVIIDSTGDVTATLGSAIYAKTSNSIDITLRGGYVQGATSGVEIVGGSASSLKNYATLTGGAFAVSATDGDDVIYNHGTIIGNVELGDGTNAFFNRSGGNFLSGESVSVGTGNTLTNEGVLSPGGKGLTKTTALNGNLVQTDTGRFVVDLDEGGAGADRIDISGTAQFDGLVVPNVIDLSSLSGSFVIADASGGLTSSASASDTRLYDFELAALGTQLILSWDERSLAEILTSPMTRNQNAVAAHLDALRDPAYPASLQVLILAVKNLPDDSSALAAMDRLSPEHYLSQVSDTLHAGLLFMNSLMSCPSVGTGTVQGGEGECYWARIGGYRSDWARTPANMGGDAEALSFSGGVQVSLGGNWRLGAALSYDETSIATGNGATADGDRFGGGIVLKNRWGDTSIAAAAFGGHGRFDTRRRIGLADAAEADGDHGIDFGGLHLRLGHQFDSGSWYVKPVVDLTGVYLAFGGIREANGGAGNLQVGGDEEWVFSARPGLEFGSEIRAPDGTSLRPFIRAGALVLSHAGFGLVSRFQDAPSGLAPLVVTSQFDDVFLDVSAGLDLLSSSGVDLKLAYDGRLAGNSEIHAGSLKIAVPF